MVLPNKFEGKIFDENQEKTASPTVEKNDILPMVLLIGICAVVIVPVLICLYCWYVRIRYKIRVARENLGLQRSQSMVPYNPERIFEVEKV